MDAAYDMIKLFCVHLFFFDFIIRSLSNLRKFLMCLKIISLNTGSFLAISNNVQLINAEGSQFEPKIYVFFSIRSIIFERTSLSIRVPHRLFMSNDSFLRRSLAVGQLLHHKPTVFLETNIKPSY